MLNKILTQCCSLCQMSATNDTTLEEIKEFVQTLKYEADQKDYYGELNEFGQRAVFCITTPNEIILEYNLQQVNFKRITGFKRRMGYPEGNLKMWILTW